ncbi:atherin-like [Brachypodium distachyon]|uniref:atherin-like n=1 Tax=Brachypodium distachyon TaxID=15368 RepID=UPI00071E4E0A|nr:atherin-like [Brachypodium distachyon]|eukprot:XP_014751734.1 atherin-like [Brachypodium distachyon]
METYQLRVAQLHPMSLYLLAIFSFLCEGFVEVMTSVALFRNYFYPHIENKKAMSSGHIAPLQRRSLPAWAYTGAGDRTCLRREGQDKGSLQVWVRGISSDDAPFVKLPPGVFALHAGVPDLSSLIGSFPPYNEWGLMDNSPTQSLRSPPPAPRGKPAQEESGSESEAGQPHDSSYNDETGRVAAAREVILVDDKEEDDDDDAPVIVRRSWARAAATAPSTAAAVAPTPAAAPGSTTATAPAAVSGAPAAPSPAATAAVAGAAAAATSAVAASTVAAPSAVPSAPQVAATPRAPTAPPARGLFRGFALRRNPSKADSLAGAGKRGRGDSPPTAPSKKAHTDAGSGADPADTGTSAPAGDLALMEVAPATGDAPPATDPLATPARTEEEGEAPPARPVTLQGPSAPASEAGATMTDLDSDVEERQELSRLREETRLAREEACLAREAQDEATVPVVPEEELDGQLEAQRAEHQEALGSLKAAQEKAEEEHRKTFVTTQAHLDEKSDLITSYAGQIQGLRVKLEVQTKATESAVTAAARHEIQLNTAKEKVAWLETELDAVREELTKAGEDNAAKAAELTSQFFNSA